MAACPSGGCSSGGQAAFCLPLQKRRGIAHGHPRTASRKTKGKTGPTAAGLRGVLHRPHVSHGIHEGKGWHGARIEPYGPLSLEPAATVFYYVQESRAFHGRTALEGRTLSAACGPAQTCFSCQRSLEQAVSVCCRYLVRGAGMSCPRRRPRNEPGLTPLANAVYGAQPRPLVPRAMSGSPVSRPVRPEFFAEPGTADPRTALLSDILSKSRC